MHKYVDAKDIIESQKGIGFIEEQYFQFLVKELCTRDSRR